MRHSSTSRACGCVRTCWHDLLSPEAQVAPAHELVPPGGRTRHLTGAQARSAPDRAPSSAPHVRDADRAQRAGRS